MWYYAEDPFPETMAAARTIAGHDLEVLEAALTGLLTDEDPYAMIRTGVQTYTLLGALFDALEVHRVDGDSYSRA
jgi:hypothetical protein